MNEDQALHIIDEQLDAALRGVVAPPGFTADVLRRTRQSQVKSLPEILDAIGWLALLALFVVLIIRFVPLEWRAYWFWAFAPAIVVLTVWFGLRSLDELGN